MVENMTDHTAAERRSNLTLNFVLSSEEDALLDRMAPQFPRGSRSAVVRKAIRELARVVLKEEKTNE